MKFSLRTLLLCTAIVAVACYALFDRSKGHWGNLTIGTLTFIGLTVAMIAAIFHPGRIRAFSGGFAIAGWLYLVMSAYMTISSDPDEPSSWPTARFMRIFIPPPKFTQLANGTSVTVSDREHAMIAGELLATLLVGLAGGLVGRSCYLAGQRVEQRQMLAKAQAESLRSGER